MLKYGVPVFLALFGMVSACGRALEPGVVSESALGTVVETPLSDAEFAKRGEKILYRFRSVPNLVMLSSPGPGAGTPVIRSTRLSAALRDHRKSNLLSTLPRPQLSLVEEPSVREGMPFREARFQEANNLLAHHSVKVVPVALLDSGVVPITKPIQNILWKSTNLTTDIDPCTWQNHGTVIASLLAGVTSGLDLRHPCHGRPVEEASTYSPPLASNVRIHSIKISFDSDSLSSLRSDLGAFQLAVALDEAVASGARVVNLSFSYTQDEPSEEVRAVESLVMAQGASKGVLFVVAAGNGGIRMDGRETYPVRYGLENVIVVGAHDESLRRATMSNFGDVVDLTAQGVALPGNGRNGEIMLFSGTSFSAPIVAAAVALYEGAFPEAKLTMVLEDLFASSNPRYAHSQRANSEAALESERPSRFGRLDVEAFIRRGLARQP